MNPKELFFLVVTGFFLAGSEVYSQVEIKGSGITGATNTLITKNNNSDTSVLVRDDGRVGIGTTSPTQKLEVKGMIYSTTGGFKCPDGTILTTAPTNYARVFTVAMSGGDFTSIQAAINACGSPSPANKYLVRVMPGFYTDLMVNCQKFVDLRGSGKYSCTIAGTVNGADTCIISDFTIMRGIVCNTTSPIIHSNLITRTDGPSAVGINVSNMGHPWIYGNEILDCTGYGIICTGQKSDAMITGNKILRNGAGGIQCMHSSPSIQNNEIDSNANYGIYLMGSESTPSSPTISDNLIGHSTNQTTTGIGISISMSGEAYIYANKIYQNDCGIEIDPPAQPNILSNEINYNNIAGIRCYSSGAIKRVVIMGNHIHSNTGSSGPNAAGVWVMNCNPRITHNNISLNRRPGLGNNFPDIDYSGCFNSYPMISLNVFDYIQKSATPASGNYNVTSAGATIAP
jgi:hypothetical protein